MNTQVYARVIVEGIHNWPNCDVPTVMYLAHPHRHQFNFVVFVNVTHGDRDVEFIDFQHQVRKYLLDKYWDESVGCCMFGAMSCEMLGQELMNKFNLSRVEVSEDNENGAVITA